MNLIYSRARDVSKQLETAVACRTCNAWMQGIFCSSFKWLNMYAALKRKGKGDDVTEDDMEGFVAAHNCEYAACSQD